MKTWLWFDVPDFIYVVPRAPYAYPGNFVGYSWSLDVPDDPEGDLAQRAWRLSEQHVADVLQCLKGKYKISDAYLLGHSQGGFLAMTAGIRFHDRFKGVICCSGGFDKDRFSPQELEQGKGLRVFIAHGAKDDVVPVENGKDARDALTEAGYAVTYHEFEGGHGLDKDALNAAHKWMKGE